MTRSCFWVHPPITSGRSEYLSRIHGVVAGSPPPCDVDDERELIGALLEAIERGVIRSAHDCSDGGLAVAIVECCIMDRADQRGATVDLGHWPVLPDRAVLYRRGAGPRGRQHGVAGRRARHRRGSRNSRPRHRHSRFERLFGADFNEVDAHRRAARAARRRLSRNDSPDHGPVGARRAVARR